MNMKVKTYKIVGNEHNPRVIRDEKFERLKKSISEFPEMLEKRPIVCHEREDGKYVIIGGNMGFRACQDLGFKEVTIMLANEWNEEQIKQFVIKDNIQSGEWDWDMLANENWDEELLSDWGLEVIKHDWEDLDYIDEEIDTPTPKGNNVIQVILPETLLDDKQNIIEDIQNYLEEKYESCEVK